MAGRGRAKLRAMPTDGDLRAKQQIAQQQALERVLLDCSPANFARDGAAPVVNFTLELYGGALGVC